MIHSVEIERVRVYRYQISSILPIKCYYHQFFMPGVVTNSWISHKLIFHVAIPHEFQCRRKWWRIDGLWCIYRYLMKTKNLGTSRTGFSKFLTKSVPWLSVIPSTSGYKHMVDFTSRFPDPQQVYGQNLLVSDQLGKGSKQFPVRMDL